MSGGMWRRVAILCVVCAWAAGIAFGWWLRGTETAVVAAPPRTDLAAQLIAQHRCWSGPAPADMSGREPRHVVATLVEGGTPEYLGRATTRAALQQVFEQVDHGIRVHAFCR